MPEKKERDSWWAFINGRPEREWNPPKKPKKSKQDYWNDPPRQQEYGTGAEDLKQYEVSYSEEVVVEATETVSDALVVNEYGEVTEDVDTEEVEAEIAAGSLPSPLATPQPESRYKSTNYSSVNRIGGPQQPTPRLLKAMDNVSIFNGLFNDFLINILIALLLASSNVFHALDYTTPGTS